MKDAKGNYIYEIIRGAIDAFDECMNDYLFLSMLFGRICIIFHPKQQNAFLLKNQNLQMR